MRNSVFSSRVLRWADSSGRCSLPWQTNITPYRVWVSEIMLQQTRAETVIPYFERFVQRFPEVRDLADACVDTILFYWSG
ncbi:MAG: A/G-specific adenine glycosylase, partial [Methylococcales bacterium]|nr:A/G-specific adenine glycosylase [Methylococcales bacterium]